MPVGSIINQPAANSINAAYRPIVLRITATKTNGDAIPPVVYCDVYINGSFYKTHSLTQYTKKNLSNTEWEFDIQDSLQEYLGKKLGVNGADQIIEAAPVISTVQCKFRSSGIDSEGFLQTEGTAPIQGTVGVDPIAGTGTASNTFFALNATLQHEDNQSLASHLSYYRNRVWSVNSYPLTHRNDRYQICKNQSDYFPIVTDKDIGTIQLNYRYRGQSSFTALNYNLECTALSFESTTDLPNSAVGNTYSFFILLSGTAPFTISSVTKPSWMTIELVNLAGLWHIKFSGTPDVGGTGIPVSLTVSNCCEAINLVINKTIDISSCTPVAFASTTDMPDPVLNTPYVFDLTLSGTLPYNFENGIYPSWMTANIVGNQIQFRGTPTEANIGTGLEVSMDIYNCGGTIVLDETIDVGGVGVTGCGGFIDYNFADDVYSPGTFYSLSLTPGPIQLLWSSGDRPNRITVYEDNIPITTTSWVGYANYGGPWGSNLNTAITGSLPFTAVAGKGYKVRIESGPADPFNIQTDNCTITVQCG